MRSESGSKVGVCKCRASKLVMSTSCHEKRNLRKKTDPFFSLLHHHTQQFYCMPTSLLYVHMMWANFVVKHNKVWNKTLDDLVSKVRDSSQHCHQTEGHHVGPRWNTFSLDALEYRNSSDAGMMEKGRLNRLLMIWNWVACRKAWELMIWKIGYMPKLSSKTGHWKFEYMPKTKLQGLWLGNWVHTKKTRLQSLWWEIEHMPKLSFKANDWKLIIFQN
jgi:hypothetical protein